MRKLLTIDKRDYDPSWPITTRKAARAIIFKGDKIYLVKSATENFYKFPGGGKKRWESINDTLVREVKEEVGLDVIKESIKPYGYTLELRKSKRKENYVFHHISYYFFCDVKERLSDLKLDDYEKELSYERVLYTLKEAYDVNHAYENDKEEHEYIIREEAVMKLLLEENKRNEENK